MSHLRLLVTAALVIALLPACKGEAEDGPAKTAGEVEAGKAPAPTTAVGEAGEIELPTAPGDGDDAGLGETGEDETGEPVDQPPLPDSFDKVGVELCDQYVVDYVACIEKAPEDQREAQRRAVFDNVRSWTQTAAGGKGAEKGLQTACRIAREQARRATQDWGCEW